MRLSWSSMQKFLSCQRAYELNYIEGLEKKPSVSHKNLLRGSAFHHGLEAALRKSAEANVTTPEMINAAVEAAKQYIVQSTIPNKTYFDWDTRQETHDADYYAMLDELAWLVPQLLAYHIPMIGLGSRYKVPTKAAVLGLKKSMYIKAELDELAIEWKFNIDLTPDGDSLSGIVDTILYDLDREEFVMVDWKTRDGFPIDSMALLDGQLHLYAGVMNDFLGANISRVVMWQFLTATPKPASISVKTGKPNTGSASYATTWKVWSETLPFGIRAKDYEDEMRPKMREDSDFQRVVEGQVTDISSELMFDNVMATLASMKAAQATEKPYPAVLGSSACKWCDFAKLCANGFRYGGDVSLILERDYQRRTRGGSIEIEEVENVL